MKNLYMGLMICVIIAVANTQQDSGYCQVCHETIFLFVKELDVASRNDVKQIETAFKEFCKFKVSVERKLCKYLGALEESSTGILNDLSKLLSPINSVNSVEEICEELSKKDAQICDLRYVRFKNMDVDLKTLKIRDLRKVLNEWDESCEACLENTDHMMLQNFGSSMMVQRFLFGSSFKAKVLRLLLPNGVNETNNLYANLRRRKQPKTQQVVVVAKEL